jgi:hypothetical protein
MCKASALYLDAVASVKGYTVRDICDRVDRLAAALQQEKSTFLKGLFYTLITRPKTQLIDPAMMKAFEDVGIPFPPGKASVAGKRYLE